MSICSVTMTAPQSMQSIKGVLKRMGNPYAKLSVFDEEMLKREAVFSRANPCAVEYLEGCRKLGSQREVDSTIKVISQRAFTTEASQILRLYSPRFKRGGRLSPEKRDFINQCKALPADKRFLALQEIRKFDIRTEGNFEPLLNRERDDALNLKLKSILNDLKK